MLIYFDLRTKVTKRYSVFYSRCLEFSESCLESHGNKCRGILFRWLGVNPVIDLCLIETTVCSKFVSYKLLFDLRRIFSLLH